MVGYSKKTKLLNSEFLNLETLTPSYNLTAANISKKMQQNGTFNCIISRGLLLYQTID